MKMLPNGWRKPQRRVCTDTIAYQLLAEATPPMLPSADRRCRLQRVLGSIALLECLNGIHHVTGLGGSETTPEAIDCPFTLHRDSANVKCSDGGGPQTSPSPTYVVFSGHHAQFRDGACL